MKKLLFATALLFAAELAQAQQSPNTAGSQGYWVVVGNTKAPKSNKVCYYSADHTLVQEEKMDGRRLNIQRKKIQDELNGKLANVLQAYEAGKAIASRKPRE